MENKIQILFLLGVVFACGSKENVPAIDPIIHKNEIDSWHQKRIESLKGPTGWLNLAGLFWLKEGINSFGSGTGNDLIFPENKIPEQAGYFLLKDNSVIVNSMPGVEIMSLGQNVLSTIAYPVDSGRAPIFEYGSLKWFIIKRDNQFGVRLRDLEHPALEKFQGIDRYPVDLAWRLEARFEKADSSRTIEITNILGMTGPQKSPGTLVFEIDDQEYRFDVIDEGGEDLFVIFGDDTNANETYGAGRYMYVSKPDENGKIILDFNKAYNPPCAFTEFATCPLPPKQNILSLEITAGEKNYGSH